MILKVQPIESRDSSGVGFTVLPNPSEEQTSREQLYLSHTPYIDSLRNACRRPSMYHVKIRKGEDGYYVAQCKELPAAITQGKTKKQAMENIKEAIELVLEDMKAEIRERKLVVVEA